MRGPKGSDHWSGPFGLGRPGRLATAVHGLMRRELVNGELFGFVLEARVVIGEWVNLSDTRRADRGVGGLTPDVYAKMARARTREPASDDQGGGGR
jgi:hypothetical protein